MACSASRIWSSRADAGHWFPCGHNQTGCGPRYALTLVAAYTADALAQEALANIAKHAHAGECTVTVRADNRAVYLQVEDDGCGGAHPGKGHGLAGLQDRLAAVEGALEITSPPGGPTVLTAQIPLDSLGAP